MNSLRPDNWLLESSTRLRIVWKTVLLASEPPEVNTIVPFFAPISFAIAFLDCSTLERANLPDSCMLDALPKTSRSFIMAALTSDLRGVVAL
jgi:hypothetical protein